MTENPDSLVNISFAWSWKSKDVVDLAIDGLYLDEYEDDDLFVAVRDALTEWLTPTTFVTKTGKVLTDAEIEALADEAEAGYDTSQLKKRP